MKADDSLMGTFGNLLRFLNNVMIEDGILLLQGCKAGGGDDGTKLPSLGVGDFDQCQDRSKRSHYSRKIGLLVQRNSTSP
jgi:hypothetical protein